MRTDIERKVQWCLSRRSVHMKEMKTKRAEGLAPFDPGIRFSEVAVDILGPVTIATSSRVKQVLVLTDLSRCTRLQFFWCQRILPMWLMR